MLQRKRRSCSKRSIARKKAPHSLWLSKCKTKSWLEKLKLKSEQDEKYKNILEDNVREQL